jgi:probable rRNA maturation factor
MPELKFSLQIATTLAQIPTKNLFKKWAKATLRVDTELTIRIVDEAEGRALNLAYRNKDYATNVLTFPITEAPYLLGDIVICAPIVAKEAAEQGKTIAAHYAHLTVHGVLHLHGYDHEIDAQAELMEAIEIQTLAKLGYANPYLIL